MNTGQTILAIGALILLGTTILTVNSTNLNQGTMLRQTELGIYAVSLATSFIQKATSMEFDELTVVRPVLPNNPTPSSYLTTSGVLGIDNPHVGHTTTEPETPNVDTTFDDFDDYDDYAKDTSVTNVDVFHVTAVVYYVSPVQPYPKTGTPSWLKRMDLKVNSSVGRGVMEDPTNTATTGVDTIRLSYIKSYY
jgi:hypothetical protein